MATITLENDTTVEVPDDQVADFRGLDSEGDWVTYAFLRQDGTEWLIGLTPCCHASGKGSEYGVVCRSCYSEVSMKFGGEATVAIGVKS